MKQAKQIIAILIVVFIAVGCKEDTESSENSQQAQLSVSASNDLSTTAFADLVLKSITERPGRTGEQEPFVIIEWRGPDSLWIGTHQITPEELKTISTIQDQHNMPHNIVMLIAKSAAHHLKIPVREILKPSGATKVITEYAKDW